MRLPYRIFSTGFFLVSLGLTNAKVVLTSVTGTGFGPSSQAASVGDVIKISFTVGSATFTQSTFDDPCTPLSGGRDSGLKTIAPGAGPQNFQFTLDTSDPLYFFNSVSNKCATGFVFALNASPQQVTSFKSNAATRTPGTSSSGQTPVQVGQSGTGTGASPRPANPPDAVTATQQKNSVATPDNARSTVSPTNIAVTISREADNNPTTSSTLPIATGSSVFSDAGGQTIAVEIYPPVHSDSPKSTFTNPLTNPSASSTTTSPAPTAKVPQSPNRRQVVTTVVGILLGLLALLAIAVVVIVRRLRRREALLPTGTNAVPDLQRTPGAQSPGASARFKRFFFRHQGWNRLDEKGERRISPFYPVHSTGTEDRDYDTVTRSDSPTTGRPLSQSTLVDSQSRIEARESLPASSLVVETSETEKSVTIHRGRVTVILDTTTTPTSNSRKTDFGDSPV